MLLGFLERFGGGDGSQRAFDYTNDAVSVRRGGIARKAQVPAELTLSAMIAIMGLPQQWRLCRRTCTPPLISPPVKGPGGLETSTMPYSGGSTRVSQHGNGLIMVIGLLQVPAAAETMRQHFERDGSAPADRLCCEDPLTSR